MREASLTEPLCVAYKSVVSNSTVNPGDTVVVIGPGPIGLLCMKMAQICGASEIIAVGTEGDDERLKMALNYGATIAINGSTDDVTSNIIDMSSIAPLASKMLSQKALEKEVTLLDAPVSGGEPKAVNATLSIMVGGPEDAFNEVKEVLLTMGSSAVLVGDIGSGNVAKLANQMIVALNIAAVSEAFVLASKAGVNPEKVFQAIRGGLAGSTVMDAKAPLILDRNFKPGFRIELHIKDLMNALDTAHEIGVPIPLTSHIMETLQALKVDGKAKDDHCSIIQYYEKMAHVEVKREK